jgi:hypothetical protein
MLSFLFVIAARIKRSRIHVHNSVNPFRGTPPITRTKWEFGGFVPTRIPADRPCQLNFSGQWKTPFFIRVGTNDPVLGEPDPGRPRAVKLPPQVPGTFPVALSFDGIQWKELGHLTVDPPQPGTPWDLIIGILIGLGIVAAACGIGICAWRGYIRKQRRQRKRRSDEGAPPQLSSQD